MTTTMFPTTVVAAVVMSMVVCTLGVGIIVEGPGQVILNCLVGAAADSGQECNPGFLKSLAGAPANSAAD